MAANFPKDLLVVDIETIPDRPLHQGDSFPKPPLHQVVVVGFVHAAILPSPQGERYQLRAVHAVSSQDDEASVLRSFFALGQRMRPRIVTFNGRGFDLPVLKYRALKHGLPAAWIHHRDYTYRFNHQWHCDLLEVLSDFGASTRPSLAELSGLLGVPTKLGIDGAAVEGEVASGNLQAVSDYCETDVLATYLLYLRYALQTELLDADGYNASTSEVADYLEEHQHKRPHLQAYLSAWEELGGVDSLLVASRTMGAGRVGELSPADAVDNAPQDAPRCPTDT